MVKKYCILFISFLAVFLSLYTNVIAQSNALNNGILSIEPNKKETISLNGEWEFYWNKLLTPLELEKKGTPHSYIQVPSSWKKQIVNNQTISRFGFGTYRTQFQIPFEDIGTQKALSLYYVGSAYRIWIDGVEYPGLGVVGQIKEKEVPQLQRKIIFFEPKNEKVEIVIQVSNYSFREGGIISEIIYGDQDRLIKSTLIETFLKLMIIGGFFIIGLYHVLIFVTKRNEHGFLFVGLASLAIAIRTLCMTEFVVNYLFPILNWETVIKVEYLSEILLFILLVLLIKSLYPQEVHIMIIRLSYAIAFIIALLISFTPPEFFSGMLLYHVAIISLIMLYFIFYVGTMAAIRRREGAIINLIGILIMLVATVNDVLMYAMILKSFYMMEYAFIIFIMLQAIVVSNRYARLFRENSILTKELLDLNQSLEEKINDRTKELHEKNEQLVKMQQARTEMLSNIAHDIGSPLVGIQMFLKIIRQGRAAVDIQKVLPQFMEKVNYIQSLNNDLFELAKLESQQLTFNIEKVGLNDFFSSMYFSIHLEKQAENISVHLGEMETTINGKEVFVQIDKLRIMQVMQNYVGNAVKFSNSPKIEIFLHCYIFDENEVMIEVEDNGVGICPNEVKYIFERFYKKSEGNSEGSGLGLAIVKAIIEQHGGRVGVESKIGEGSRFYFTLPIDMG